MFSAWRARRLVELGASKLSDVFVSPLDSLISVFPVENNLPFQKELFLFQPFSK